MEKNSNILKKTIIFILVVALSCLIFFGLGSTNKTELELVSFSFITFAEFVVYLSVLIPSFIKFKKLQKSDLIAAGILYFIASIAINLIFFNSFSDVKTLVVSNAIEIILFLIIITIISLRKN